MTLTALIIISLLSISASAAYYYIEVKSGAIPITLNHLLASYTRTNYTDQRACYDAGGLSATITRHIQVNGTFAEGVSVGYDSTYAYAEKTFGYAYGTTVQLEFNSPLAAHCLAPGGFITEELRVDKMQEHNQLQCWYGRWWWFDSRCPEYDINAYHVWYNNWVHAITAQSGVEWTL